MDWEAFIDGLKDDAGKLWKAELKAFIKGALSDRDSFLRKQADTMKSDLAELASKQITPADYRERVERMKIILEVRKLSLEIEAQVRAQNVVNGIQRLILDGLLTVV